MKTYLLKGYIKPKEQENADWQEIREDYTFKIKDDVNPYEAIQEMFKTVLSYWLIVIKEIKEE